MLGLSPRLRAQIEDWAAAGYPEETCGLLLGRALGEGTAVEQATHGHNLNRVRAHDRFELDPRDFIAAEHAARDAGLEIVGVWHSHPDHPAHPSETDRACAWAGWSYLIVAVDAGGAVDSRSWRLAGGDGPFAEEALVP